jgi:hypothetical protein
MLSMADDTGCLNLVIIEELLCTRGSSKHIVGVKPGGVTNQLVATTNAPVDSTSCFVSDHEERQLLTNLFNQPQLMT